MKRQSEEILFDVTLHHLAPDAGMAGADIPETELMGIRVPELRRMLQTVTVLAPSVQYPVLPELRITSPHGRFLIQVRDGRIRFSSWALKSGSSELTPDQILAAITGIEAGEDSGASMSAPAFLTALAPARRSMWVTVGLLAAAILLTNAATVWLLTRPEPDLLPQHQLMEGPPAQRLMADVAGQFETGGEEGDRSLSIAPDGGIRWVLFGPNRAVAEETLLTSRPAQSLGAPALLTSNRALIEIKDQMTITFYRDVYRRKR